MKHKKVIVSAICCGIIAQIACSDIGHELDRVLTRARSVESIARRAHKNVMRLDNERRGDFDDIAPLVEDLKSIADHRKTIKAIADCMRPKAEKAEGARRGYLEDIIGVLDERVRRIDERLDRLDIAQIRMHLGGVQEKTTMHVKDLDSVMRDLDVKSEKQNGNGAVAVARSAVKTTTATKAAVKPPSPPKPPAPPSPPKPPAPPAAAPKPPAADTQNDTRRPTI